MELPLAAALAEAHLLQEVPRLAPLLPATSLPPATSLLEAALSSAHLHRRVAGDFCPAGSLNCFSTAGGGGAGSAATGVWTLGPR